MLSAAEAGQKVSSAEIHLGEVIYMRNIANENENIAELQRYLREIHHADGSVPLVNPDGIYGSETADAVRKFQSDNGMTVTGRADFSTWNAIYEAYIKAVEKNSGSREIYPFPEYGNYEIVEGENSDTVAIIQLMLKLLSAFYDDIGGAEKDGIYNEATMKDIRSFQSRAGVPVTGRIDKITWNALASEYNRLMKMNN